MRRQQGATLAVALILLLVITLLGMSAIQMTQMQEKMSANLEDKTQAFNAAESALIAGENWVLSLTSEPTVVASCGTPPCIRTPYSIDFTTQTNAWWLTNGASYTSSLKNIATPGRYVVEFIQYVSDSPMVGNSTTTIKGIFYYQVTARGTGATDNAVSIIQTVVARRF